MKEKKGTATSKTDDIMGGLKQLQKALESGSYKDTLMTPAHIEVTDAYLPLNHLFNAASKKAFKKEVKTLTAYRKGMFDEVIEDKVAFFSCTAVGERNIFDAAKRVANTVNEYAAEELVTGFLVKLSIVKLFSEDWELEKYVVFSYPCMTPAGYESASNLKRDTWTVEGGTSMAVVK